LCYAPQRDERGLGTEESCAGCGLDSRSSYFCIDCDALRASGRTVKSEQRLRAQLVEDNDIAPFVNVYVEGEDVRTLDGLETPVAFGSTVILLPAMAGGGA